MPKADFIRNPKRQEAAGGAGGNRLSEGVIAPPLLLLVASQVDLRSARENDQNIRLHHHAYSITMAS